MLPMKIDGRLQIFDEAARQSSLTHPRCCAADRPVRDACVSQAIGQSFDWLAPAKAEVFGARVADRPAAFPLAELEQRASASVVDRDVFRRRLRPRERRHQHRDCLDHVLIFGEWHLRRILTLYSLYYNETRTHLGLVQGRPAPRIRPTIWNHYGHTNLVRIASSLRADMIFGKDRFDSRRYCALGGSCAIAFNLAQNGQGLSTPVMRPTRHPTKPSTAPPARPAR